MIPPPKLDQDLRARVIGRLGHGASLDAACDNGGALEGSEGTAAAGTPSCLVAGQSLGYRLLGSEVAHRHRERGLRVVIAEGFAPPCEISLAHAGVVPLRFLDPGDYEQVEAGDDILLSSFVDRLRTRRPISVDVRGNDVTFEVSCDLDERSLAVLLSGGLLEYLKQSRA
jgi:aconitate hydratase